MRKQTKQQPKTQDNKKNLLVAVLIFVVLCVVIAVGSCSDKSNENEAENVPVVTDVDIREEAADETEKQEKTPEETPQNVDGNTVILTLETSKEFAEVMASKDNSNGLYSKFGEEQKGKEIEFDAHIDLVRNHGDYKTRWDILLSGGDWVDPETVSPGPQFKFEDVGMTSMGIKDLYLPDWVRVSSNVKVTAKVVEYDTDAGVMMLKPILLEKR